jgi:hypothetical protein
MLQPVKVSTPATAFLGFAVQVRVAPAGVVMVRVTEAVLVVTVLALASWMVTTGWVPKIFPTLARFVRVLLSSNGGEVITCSEDVFAKPS